MLVIPFAKVAWTGVCTRYYGCCGANHRFCEYVLCILHGVAVAFTDLGAFLGLLTEGRHSPTPSDCFETFPFPLGWESDARLEAVGKEYYEFRAQLMVRNGEA